VKGAPNSSATGAGSRRRGEGGDDVGELGPVGGRLAAAGRDGEDEAAGFGAAHGLLASG
jgi:hypothetical protein